MNRLTKLLSIVAFISLGVATENTEETIVEKLAISEESTSNDVSTNQDMLPIDTDKIVKVRQIKAQKRKANALYMLNKHKNPVNSSDPNMEAYSARIQAENKIKQNQRNGLLKTFADGLRKKFQTKRLQAPDGENAFKLPSNAEAK